MADSSPETYADNMKKMKASSEGFTIIKQGIGFHSAMPREVPNFFYGEVDPKHNNPYDGFSTDVPHPHRGPLTERGLKHIIACVEAMKSVLGDEVGLALDCGPGWMLSDAIRLARP